MSNRRETANCFSKLKKLIKAVVRLGDGGCGGATSKFRQQNWVLQSVDARHFMYVNTHTRTNLKVEHRIDVHNEAVLQVRHHLLDGFTSQLQRSLYDVHLILLQVVVRVVNLRVQGERERERDCYVFTLILLQKLMTARWNSTSYLPVAVHTNAYFVLKSL